MSSSLQDIIQAKACQSDLPHGEVGYVIDVHDVEIIAREQAISGWQVEAAALKMEVIPTRYLRNMEEISITAQTQLLHSTIAQVGLGGLGGSLLEISLRAGIGTIRGADGDHFEASNLNRQALSTPANLEQPKAMAAQERAQHINPSVDFSPNTSFLTADSMPAFLDGATVAIDALGGLTSRLALQSAAANAGIPLVTGALAGWTGYIGVVLPGMTGPADIMGQDNAAEEKLGCPAPAVTLMASIMATETIKLLSEGTSSLEGKMLIIDLKDLTFETISI